MKNGSRYRARVLAALLLIVVAAAPANAAIEAGGSSTHLKPAGSLIPPLTRTTVRNQASVAGGKKGVPITPRGNWGYYRRVLD